MIREWEYDRGEWKEIDDPIAEITEEKDWDTAIQQAGYHREGRYGAEYSTQLEVFTSQEQTPITDSYKFVVMVDLFGYGGYCVYLPDLPSLLMFLREFGSHFQQQTQVEFLQLLETALRKAFHVWHEHDIEWVCMECDPDEVRSRRIRQEQDRQKKAEAEKQKGNPA